MVGSFKAFSKAALCLLCLFILPASIASVHATEVTLAGFSFAGQYASAQTRFPYSFALYQQMDAASSVGALSRDVNKRSKGISNPAFTFTAPESLVNLKNSDQALMAVLVLTGETVSTESFGSYHKTFVNLRGDALIFDFKNKTIVRNYPISTFIFDATPDQPSAEHIRDLVKSLLLREDENGLVSQFVKRIGSATLPSPGNRNIQVHKVEITPEALSVMPDSLKNDPQTVQALLADSFGSIVSSRLGVPMLPTALGHLGAAFSMRLQNGDDINLKIDEGDYLFDLKINKFAQKESGKNNVGASYVYGVYTTLRFFEPTQNTDYINTDLKNGEVKVVPASQVAVDDFPAYEAALRGLFIKFSETVAQKQDMKWISVGASAKDIDKQVEAMRQVIKACK